MPAFQWDNEKNEWLKKNRGVGFEEIIILMEQGKVLDIVEHSNQEKYRGQKIAVVQIDDYAFLVPYVQESGEIFLKTIIPSRKATDKYLRSSK